MSIKRDMNRVLEAIVEIQGDSNNYVGDLEIAERTGFPIEDVRGYMDTLEDDDLLQSANSHSGYRAHLYPKHKIKAKHLIRETAELEVSEPANTEPIETEDVPGWRTLAELGEGGQGKVYLARDERQVASRELYLNVANSIKTMTDMSHGEDAPRERAFGEFRNSVLQIVRAEDPSRLGALKLLHQPEDARNAELANARVKKEVTAMERFTHPNLLQVLDLDSSCRWYVSKYYRHGDLAANLHTYAGKVRESLEAFRPLVDAVALLHRDGFVHRDIKPQNIFLGESSELVLGDFGLVFFEDEQHTRISNTLSNVGSRDWMPLWAQGKRVEEVSPKFDVFSLGKVLWSMVSGKPKLLGWYFEDEDYAESNIENLFPNNPEISLVQRLLRKCVVEREKNCLADASALLAEVDQVLQELESPCAIKDGELRRNCIVCGKGEYMLMVDREKGEKMLNLGITPRGKNSFKIFRCDFCGHTQFFWFGPSDLPSWG